jgi:hypothetical protein
MSAIFTCIPSVPIIDSTGTVNLRTLPFAIYIKDFSYARQPQPVTISLSHLPAWP